MAKLIERPPSDQEIIGSIFSWLIPKTLLVTSNSVSWCSALGRRAINGLIGVSLMQQMVVSFHKILNLILLLGNT